MSLDKGKAIESALAQIEKKFGKGSIMRLGERPNQEIGAISTTCLSLDAAIGVGGQGGTDGAGILLTATAANANSFCYGTWAVTAP